MMQRPFVIHVHRFVVWTGSLGLVEVIAYLSSH